MIPASTWGGTLTECGLKEGYVLYFSCRALQSREGLSSLGHRREGSHPRSPGAPLGSPKVPTMASIGHSVAGGLDPLGEGAGGFGFDKNKDRKNLSRAGLRQGLPPAAKAKVELDEMGNSIKREKAAVGARERAKKPSVKKEPKMITIYFRLLQKKPPAPDSDPGPLEDSAGADPEQKTQPVPEPGAPFSRQVQVGEKARLRQLKRAILDELALGDLCDARIWANGEHQPVESALVSALGTCSVEVETYLSVSFSVAGKGSSYVTTLEVSPSEPMAVLRSRVPFYKMFAQRRYTLQLEGATEPIDDASLAAVLWRDSGVKHGSRLIMKEPARERAVLPAAAAGSARGEGATAVEFEVGEGEFEEGGFEGEGGEDEMVEMGGGEGGEDEMVEMGQGPAGFGGEEGEFEMEEGEVELHEQQQQPSEADEREPAGHHLGEG